ncbi:hypothetical protein Moror_2252 [Moniliophthora roreri MCA 2997]|uniref:Ribonuclease H1 N-terminal domain-containing protein n=2 Tax=Moniliophthora roreri TaxID=221103 RepID=V2WLZ9_MONRO|nr:hypothetical protein Moror_2252 [Moniliophthora roreri MCA 2997]
MSKSMALQDGFQVHEDLLLSQKGLAEKEAKQQAVEQALALADEELSVSMAEVSKVFGSEQQLHVWTKATKGTPSKALASQLCTPVSTKPGIPLYEDDSDEDLGISLFCTSPPSLVQVKKPLDSPSIHSGKTGNYSAYTVYSGINQEHGVFYTWLPTRMLQSASDIVSNYESAVYKGFSNIDLAQQFYEECKATVSQSIKPGVYRHKHVMSVGLG